MHSHTAKLIDELIKAGKPYQLQVFPSERHGVRTPHASKHLEIALVSFVLNHL
jgi:dipeptidyl aminopeptidase/acylaminoacyl peptidase